MKRKQRPRSRRRRARDLVEIHVVQGETAWVHTHGLSAQGLPELEMRDVPCYLGRAAGALLNDIAGYLLDPVEPVQVGELIGIGPGEMVQLVRAEPQENLIEGHYDHERWTVVDPPICTCPTCIARARGPH